MMKRPARSHLRSAVGVHHDDVARVEEPVFVEGLLGQLGVAEVARTHIGSLFLIPHTHAHAQTQLAAADARLAVVLLIRVEITHVRHVLQTHVTARHRATHVPAGVVVRVGKQRGARRLRGAVALHHLVAEHAAEEGEHFGGERRRAGDGDEDAIEANGLLDLAEDEGVVEPVRVVAAREPGGLGLHATVEKELGEAAPGVDVLHHLLVNLVEAVMRGECVFCDDVMM